MKKEGYRKASTVGAFIGRPKSPNPGSSPSNGKKKKLKDQKSSEVLDYEVDEPQDEESKKLMSQIEDLVGTLGIEDPLMSKKRSGSRSRRGSFVPSK